MSERKQIQDDLVEFIEAMGYNAPYGVLTSVRPIGSGGKVRTITFGMAATLDAEMFIWSKKKITLRTQGPLSRLFQRDYDSVDAVKRDLASAVGETYVTSDV